MKFLYRLFASQKSEVESNISRALRAVVDDDNQSTRHALHHVILNQHLILPLTRPPLDIERDDHGRLTKPAHIEFLSCQDRNGSKFIAVFTSPQALNKWKRDVPAWAAADTPAICGLALESGHTLIKINPGSKKSVELRPDEIQMLAGAKTSLNE